MAGFSLPYLLGRGGIFEQELSSLVYDVSTVVAELSVERPMVSSSAGVAIVTADLFTQGGPEYMSGSTTGVVTVGGNLQVGVVDGDGDFIVELVGSSAGVATVTVTMDPPNRPAVLYLYVNVGVGFDNYDDPSGRADYVAFTGVDGDNSPSLLPMVLHQAVNVGVSFDDYDLYSGPVDFIDQTYPDGHNRDVGRYLYQYLCVIKGRSALGKLAILPSYADRHEYVPRPEPPSNEFS